MTPDPSLEERAVEVLIREVRQLLPSATFNDANVGTRLVEALTFAGLHITDLTGEDARQLLGAVPWENPESMEYTDEQANELHAKLRRLSSRDGVE